MKIPHPGGSNSKLTGPGVVASGQLDAAEGGVFCVLPVVSLAQREVGQCDGVIVLMLLFPSPPYLQVCAGTQPVRRLIHESRLILAREQGTTWHPLKHCTVSACAVAASLVALPS